MNLLNDLKNKKYNKEEFQNFNKESNCFNTMISMSESTIAEVIEGMISFFDNGIYFFGITIKKYKNKIKISISNETLILDIDEIKRASIVLYSKNKNYYKLEIKDKSEYIMYIPRHYYKFYGEQENFNFLLSSDIFCSIVNGILNLIIEDYLTNEESYSIQTKKNKNVISI